MAQNPNINFTSGSNIINVNGTIVKTSSINNPLKYSAGQPVDPNNKDPIIKGLNYRIDSSTGKVQYIDTNNGNATFNSLNEFAKSPGAYLNGYTTNTTKTIQTAMQKNLASAIDPTGVPTATPSGGGGGGGLFDLQGNVAGITTQFGKLQFKKGETFQYPKHALYTGKNAQDHLTIIKYSYKAPYGSDIFNENANILKNGLTRGSALKEFLGIVKLPMPNNISDSNNVSWGDDNMNNLTAAAVSKVLPNVESTGTKAIAAELLGKAFGVGGGGNLAASADIYMKLIQDAFASEGNGKTIGGAAGASKLLSMAGFSVSPESILARSAGIVPNSNLELLFNSPTLREFSFQYRMSPRGKEEAKIINNIIRFFKQGMAAKKTNGKSGAAAYFLGTPDVFQLSYRTTNDSPIKGVNRIKTCALTGFAMNYAADGNWAAYDEGQPVSVIMNMSFKELEPIYDTDYQDKFADGREFTEGKNDTGDLYPISDEDVGY